MAGKRTDSTEAPFAEAFTELKQQAGHSFREISRLLNQRDGRGVSPSHLADLANGYERPSLTTIAAIAAIYGHEPDFFAEYRLAQYRALFDEASDQGLGGALAAERDLPAGWRERARRVDPVAAPHAVPANAGPGMRRRRAAA